MYGPNSLPGYQADTYYMNGLGDSGGGSSSNTASQIFGAVNTWLTGRYGKDIQQTQADLAIKQAGYGSTVDLARIAADRAASEFQFALESKAATKKLIAYSAIGVGALAIIGILGASYL